MTASASFFEQARQRIQSTGNILCVGIDPDLGKMPEGFSADARGMADFCRELIALTSSVAAAYKVNTAFFEQLGRSGWEALAEVAAAVPGGIPVICDAKRGDIGNTSLAYAKGLLRELPFGAITVAPYMGRDSVEPFLSIPGAAVFLLALTSNAGSADFQRLRLHDGSTLWQRVIEESGRWAAEDALGYVAGATDAAELAAVRQSVPGRWLLIPGVGAQGGNAADVLRANGSGPALVNVSRGISYPTLLPGESWEDGVARSALSFASELPGAL